MSNQTPEDWQIAEAVLFSSPEPVDLETLKRYLPGRNLAETLKTLEQKLAGHGIQLHRVGQKWQLRTKLELAHSLALKRRKKITLSSTALEVLAAIAYFQPVTRTEIEEMRARKVSTTTLETLMKLGWIAPKGRRQTPGKPVTWGTTEKFLIHFGLANLQALPNSQELGKFPKRLPLEISPEESEKESQEEAPEESPEEPQEETPEESQE